MVPPEQPAVRPAQLTAFGPPSAATDQSFVVQHGAALEALEPAVQAADEDRAHHDRSIPTDSSPRSPTPGGHHAPSSTLLHERLSSAGAGLSNSIEPPDRSATDTSTEDERSAHLVPDNVKHELGPLPITDAALPSREISSPPQQLDGSSSSKRPRLSLPSNAGPMFNAEATSFAALRRTVRLYGFTAIISLSVFRSQKDARL